MGGDELGLGFEQAVIGMALASPEGRIERVNRALCALLARPAVELRDAGVTAVTHPDDPAGGEAWLRALGPGAPPLRVERPYRRGDGNVADLRVTVTMLGDGGRLLVQAQDITEHARVARALRASEERLRSVVANAPIVLSAFNRDGVCVFSAGRAFERLGVNPSDRVGRSFVELRGDLPEATDDFRRLLAGETVTAKRPVGDAVFDVIYHPLPDAEGDGGGVISVAVDVTEQDRADRDRRELLHRLITAQEDERRRLAGDLHDDAIQSLAAALMHLGALQARLATSGPVDPAARHSLGRARDAIEHGLESARTFLLNLRPPLLDVEGLEAALGQQLERLARRGGCQVQLDWRLPGRLDPDVEVAVFRVAQEALTNVAKHARASSVRVAAWQVPDGVAVTVSDNGAGFDPAEATARAAATGHLGLHSMRERIDSVGGRLVVEAAPGRGTTIWLHLPGR